MQSWGYEGNLDTKNQLWGYTWIFDQVESQHAYLPVAQRSTLFFPVT